MSRFTEEQLVLKEMAQEFFEKEVRPVMAEIDARPNSRDCYPHDLIRKGSELGLRTLALPEEYGGIGADLVTETLVLSTMAETEAGLAKLFSQCWKISRGIMEAGTEEQKKKFMTQFANDPDCVLSLCITEPNAGSDNAAPYNPPPGQGIATTAVADGDDFILNGTKHLVSLAGFSKIMVVLARTAPELPQREGTTFFIVPSDLPGVSFGQVHQKMGWRLYPNGEIFFDKVRVPKANILGKLNGAAETAAKMNRGDLETPAVILGLCKAIYGHCLQHARTRVQGGKPIIQHPTVGSQLSEMAMMIDVQEGYMYDSARIIDTDPNYDRKKVRYGRIFARESMNRIMPYALDIMASAGIMRDHPIEKLFRDGLTKHHGSGPNSLLRLRTMPT